MTIPLQQILDGLPAERRVYVEARARELIAETALTDALAPVVPLSPGERPTEPGWYVMARFGQERVVVEVTDAFPLQWRETGFQDTGSASEIEILGHTFIARIHPDRIEGLPQSALQTGTVVNTPGSAVRYLEGQRDNGKWDDLP
ncbi:hypothetical protein MKK88_01015 [Methylobacterium sp. E-005]|uniref:hypothetical protein n=1 Tax=Methylobacterium sp. E-005 TaxID=2836549 RepID=UPI001FB92BAF|nr:hypothetical protein [Methylobacterium sp. E-005]MCJ2084576.1 hypothetical protein [Methylobacterium sp. E-005]